MMKNTTTKETSIMSKALKGSKTEANLMTAFAGEAQARTKYSYYASKARKEGYEQVANFFEETADNEKEHAKIWFELLHGGSVPDTSANLLAAANGENGEWTSMYERMAKEAKEEGFNDIASLFQKVGEIEKAHEARYLTLLENIKNNSVFKKDKPQAWHCLNCGHLHEGGTAPDSCPVCNHPQCYFQVKAGNY
jgi:rubrerythrin